MSVSFASRYPAPFVRASSRTASVARLTPPAARALVSRQVWLQLRLDQGHAHVLSRAPCPAPLPGAPSCTCGWGRVRPSSPLLTGWSVCREAQWIQLCGRRAPPPACNGVRHADRPALGDSVLPQSGRNQRRAAACPVFQHRLTAGRPPGARACAPGLLTPNPNISNEKGGTEDAAGMPVAAARG